MTRHLFTYAPQQYMIKSGHPFTAHHDKIIFFPFLDDSLFGESFDEFLTYGHTC